MLSRETGGSVTWLRTFGTFTFAQEDQSINVVQVPEGETIRRVHGGFVARWSEPGGAGDDSNLIHHYFGVQTVRSGYVPAVPSAHTAPLVQLAPPGERWLYWAVLGSVHRGTVRDPTGWPLEIWGDDGTAQDFNSQSQVTNTFASQTLNVWVSYYMSGVPLGTAKSSLEWWLEVLYD
jgi:hypothetical protein